jgi:hypothetical protein
MFNGLTLAIQKKFYLLHVCGRFEPLGVYVKFHTFVYRVQNPYTHVKERNYFTHVTCLYYRTFTRITVCPPRNKIAKFYIHT